MRKALTILLVAVPAALCSLPDAHAQTAGDAAATFEEGNRHLQRALATRSPRVRRRELQSALRLFHQTLQAARSRSVIYNVAYCYERLERFEDAFAYYTEYLAFEDLPAQDRTEAQQRLDAIRPRVALVEVTSEPPGATIYVDRRDLSPRGVTPFTIATRPGDHRILLDLDGHEPAEAPVTTTLGQVETVRLALQARPATVRIISDPPGGEVRFDDEAGPVAGVTPLEASLPAGPHRVYVTRDDRAGREVFDAPAGEEITLTVTLGAPTTPGVVDIVVDLRGAAVSVDGQEVGFAPIRRLRLTPGRHRITVEGDDDHESWSDVVEIGPGHRVNLDVHLASALPRRRFGPWPTVAMAVGGAIAIAGGAVGGWALALHSDFRDIEQTCEDRSQACVPGTLYHEEALELADRIRPLSIAADVLFGTAGALAIVSFALMLLNREIEDSSGVRVGLAPGPGGAMATLDFGGAR